MAAAQSFGQFNLPTPVEQASCPSFLRVDTQLVHSRSTCAPLVSSRGSLATNARRRLGCVLASEADLAWMRFRNFDPKIACSVSLTALVKRNYSVELPPPFSNVGLSEA